MTKEEQKLVEDIVKRAYSEKWAIEVFDCLVDFDEVGKKVVIRPDWNKFDSKNNDWWIEEWRNWQEENADETWQGYYHKEFQDKLIDFISHILEEDRKMR